MRVNRPRFHLVLEAVPGPVAPLARLKRLLKVALRRFGLRCVALEERR